MKGARPHGYPRRAGSHPKLEPPPGSAGRDPAEVGCRARPSTVAAGSARASEQMFHEGCSEPLTHPCRARAGGATTASACRRRGSPLRGPALVRLDLVSLRLELHEKPGAAERSRTDNSSTTLQRWPTACSRASTRNNVPVERHSALLDIAGCSRFVPRGVPRDGWRVVPLRAYGLREAERGARRRRAAVMASLTVPRCWRGAPGTLVTRR